VVCLPEFSEASVFDSEENSDSEGSLDWSEAIKEEAGVCVFV
jgi:hypothetical protein